MLKSYNQQYKRILLKFSGKVLSGDTSFGIQPQILNNLVLEIGALIKLNIEVGVVIGGGNLFRGNTISSIGISRITGDHIGMLSTLINSLALRDAFEYAGFKTKVMSAFFINGIVDQYNQRKAINHLSHGNIVIFAGGTGNPLVTTDSAASLRAIETKADILLKATSVDGIYNSDPKKNNNASLYHNISFNEILRKELRIMDLSAFIQCRDHKMKIIVFNINKKGALLRIVKGEREGTLVK